MTVVADTRRKQILAAAQVCFTRAGFHQTGMADICGEAGLSPGSAYRYFRSKADIIAAMVDDCREESRGWFAELATADDMADDLWFLNI